MKSGGLIGKVKEAKDLVRRVFKLNKLLLEYGFGKPATRAEISITDETKRTASPDEIIKKIQNSAHSFKEIADTYVHSLPNADLSENDE